jgi:Flp pilus assembly pilin Flp
MGKRERASARTAVVMDRVGGREAGQGMAEYAVVLAGVALVVLLSLYALGDRVGSVLSTIAKSVG